MIGNDMLRIRMRKGNESMKICIQRYLGIYLLFFCCFFLPANKTYALPETKHEHFSDENWQHGIQDGVFPFDRREWRWYWNETDYIILDLTWPVCIYLTALFLILLKIRQ